MAGKPVLIGIGPRSDHGGLVHALINNNRVGCYRPFFWADPVTPALMIERKLNGCPYCWPFGVIWPESGK